MGEGWRILRRLASDPRAYSLRWLVARWLFEMAKTPTRREREEIALSYRHRRRY